MTRPCVEPLLKITGEEIDSSGRSRTSTIRRDGRIHDLDRAQLEMGPVDGLELQPRALNYRPLGREIARSKERRSASGATPARLPRRTNSLLTRAAPRDRAASAANSTSVIAIDNSCIRRLRPASR